MRKHLLATTFIAMFGSAVPADAAELTLRGYDRLRLLLFHDLAPWNEAAAGEAQTQGLWMHRARLMPEIAFDKNVSFHLVVNVFDNTPAGDAPTLASSGGQSVSEFFSQAAGPSGDYRNNLFVERAWGQVMTPVGQFRFGRMGSQWGLGILANEGNGLGDDYGDTVDRVLFATRLGPVYVIPAIDKLSETTFLANGGVEPDFFADPTSIGGSHDDVDQYVLAVVYRGEVHSLGGYGVLRRQQATSGQALIGDLWGKTRVGPVNIEAEWLLLRGETDSFINALPGTFSARQWGFAVETDAQFDRYGVGFDFGAASGDDEEGAGNLSSNALTFDANYRIALLLFHYIPGEPGGALGVSNALYVRPWVRYSFWDGFHLDVVAAHAKALEPSQFHGSTTYGTELDLATTWQVYENFEWTLTGGALLPGQAYETAEPPTDKADDLALGVEGRMLIRF